MEKMKISNNLEPVVELYFADGAKRLYNMVDKILFKLHFTDVNKEDFYSLANEIFVAEVLPNYDSNKSFEGFLYSTLYKKFCSEMTARTRYKRCRKIKKEERDEYGNTVIKEIIIPDGYLYEPIGDEDGSTLEDTLPYGKTVESEIFEEKEEGYSQKMLLYLSKLSNLQKDVLRLIVAGYSPREIREELHISEKQYADCNAAIRAYKNISILF